MKAVASGQTMSNVGVCLKDLEILQSTQLDRFMAEKNLWPLCMGEVFGIKMLMSVALLIDNVALSAQIYSNCRLKLAIN